MKVFSYLLTLFALTTHLQWHSDKAFFGGHNPMNPDKLEHGGAPFGILDSVAAASDHQREGIGKALMQHAKDIRREKGCCKIMLSSDETRTDAHRFYEAIAYGSMESAVSWNFEVWCRRVIW